MAHRFVAFSCLHAPITHQPYFEWLIGQIEDFRPDTIVNLGDWIEAKWAKKWPKWDDEDWTIFDEFRAVATQANAITAAAPDARKVWLWGNHCSNGLGIHPDRINSDLRDAVQIENFVPTATALKDWRVIKEYSHRAKYRLGPVTCQHGCSVTRNAEKDASYLYGTPYGLYICGHTHRPVEVTRAEERGIRLPYWYANPGTGIDVSRAHYMDRMSMARWGRGLIVGEIPESSAEQGRTAYTKKNWDAELRIQGWIHE